MTRLVTALFLCAFAVFMVPAGAQALQFCAGDQSYRTACAGSVERTGCARRAKGKGHFKGASTSRTCLTRDTRAVLERAEAHFGARFHLVSTCRPGARIAGSGRVSQHALNRAVDFKVPRGTSKEAVVRWLHARARGVTMTYRNMAHVHFDTGPHHALIRGANAYRGLLPANYKVASR